VEGTKIVVKSAYATLYCIIIAHNCVCTHEVAHACTACFFEMFSVTFNQQEMVEVSTARVFYYILQCSCCVDFSGPQGLHNCL